MRDKPRTYEQLSIAEKIELHMGKANELTNLLKHTPKCSPDYDYISTLVDRHLDAVKELVGGEAYAERKEC